LTKGKKNAKLVMKQDGRKINH